MGKAEERNFHDLYVTSGDLRSLENRFYSAAAEAKENDIAFDFLGDLCGKRLLFYGSGCHFSMIRKFIQRGAEVTAIDISPETIKILVQAVEREGFQAKCTCLVMDCESLDFKDRSFDIVFARSIIHHLDIDTSLREIFKVLKPNGNLTALEPLGTNPLINVYRRFTPHSRTSGEHPLVTEDLKKFERYFPQTQARYLYFLSVLAYLYRMLDQNERRFLRAFSFLNAVDEFLLRVIPAYRYLCWDVLLCCQKGA